jgi:hypothetical protein
MNTAVKEPMVWDRPALLTEGDDNMVTKKQPKKREYQKMPYSLFLDNANKLNLTERNLAVACGYSQTSVVYWIKTGQCPKSAVLASEALVRRNGQLIKQPTVLIAKVPADKDEMVRSFLKAIGVDYQALEV